MNLQTTLVYNLPASDLLLTDNERPYVLRVRDFPAEEKPRQKLMRYGPGALSLSELLAVVFGDGGEKEKVLAMSGRLLKEYGEKAISDQRDAKMLARKLDIPLAKACQLVACFELGRRFFAKPKGRPEFLRTARQVFDYARDMRLLPKEHLRGIYLNNHYRLVHDEVISIGTLDASIIHPREVFKPALEHSASAVILVHNHPSGVVAPSKSDIDITRQMVEAGKLLGIFLLDHIIVTDQKFISIPADYAH